MNQPILKFIMKNLTQACFLCILLIFLIPQTNAQLNCDISIGQTMPVCPNFDFELSAQDYNDCTYTWYKNGEPIEAGSNVIFVSIRESAYFTVTIHHNPSQYECTSDPFYVSCRIPFTIDFDQLQLTCTNSDNDNGNNAKVKAIAFGEFEPDEYHYFWNISPLQIAPGDSSLAIGLRGHQEYVIEVRDNYGCSVWDTVRTETYDNPFVIINAEPDTAYYDSPYVTFSFTNLSSDSIQVTDLYWDFGDCSEESLYWPQCLDDITTIQTEPTHMYGLPINNDTTYYVTLTVFNQEGCDTTYTKTILIRKGANTDEISDQEVSITLNGNQVVIKNSSNSTYSKIHIYNQSGQLIEDLPINFKEEKMLINIEGWEHGLYIFMLENEGSFITKKIII